jgi:hypothetical protein
MAFQFDRMDAEASNLQAQEKELVAGEAKEYHCG